MDNTQLYLSHYANNLDRDLLLFPVKGMFVNLSTYLITFNDIEDTSKLKAILEFFGYEQVAAFKIGDLPKFEKIRQRVDMIIDSIWAQGKIRPSTINHSVNGATSQGNIKLHDKTIAPTKNLNLYLSESYSANRNNIRYGANTKLILGERTYANRMDKLISYESAKNKFIDKFLDFNARRINSTKLGTVNYTLFETENLKTAILLNSLQNSIITKDFNPTTLIVFSPYTVRHANLLQTFFSAYTTKTYEIAYLLLKDLDSYKRNGTKFNSLFASESLQRYGTKFTQFTSDRILHNFVNYDKFMFLPKIKLVDYKIPFNIMERRIHNFNPFNKIDMSKYNPSDMFNMTWLDGSTSAESFLLNFGNLGNRYAKPTINESLYYLWGTTNPRVSEKPGNFVLIDRHNLDGTIIDTQFSTNRINTFNAQLIGNLKEIAWKSKFIAVEGMYEFSRKITRMATKFETEFSALIQEIDVWDKEFADKLKPTYIPTIEFADKPKPTYIPTIEFGTKRRPVYLPDIEFMYKSLNTEMILFSTIDGKLNRKESVLAGVLLETAQWLTAKQVSLQYSNSLEVDKNHNKIISDNLGYTPVVRNTIHPGTVHKPDDKMDKQKEYQDPIQPVGIDMAQHDLVINNDGSTGAERYQKQANPADQMFAVSPSNKEGQVEDNMITISNSNKKSIIDTEMVTASTHPKESGTVSEPFKIVATHPKESGNVSEPFRIVSTHPKESGNVSDPFTLGEKGHSKIGAELKDSLWTYARGKYSSIHDSYIAMDNCLKECSKIYDYLTTTYSNKIGISESLEFTWCSVNSKSTMIHDQLTIASRVGKNVQNPANQFLTTKQKIELFKVQETQMFVDKKDSNVLVKDNNHDDLKTDKDIVLDEAKSESYKDDRNIDIALTTHETEKVEKPIELVDRRLLTTKQLHDLFLAEQQAKLEKKDSDIIVLDDITELEKVDDNITINSMSYVIEKNPADITMGDMFMALKGTSTIYIPLNTVIRL